LKDIFSKFTGHTQGSINSNADYNEDNVKISGTKWYVDIEYKGQIARFGGDMCNDGFAAIASSMSWIKHIGELLDGEQLELMRAAVSVYHKRHKRCYLRFYDDNNEIIEF
jgi:hypothetical protein